MFRNSVLYHRILYARRRNARSLHLLARTAVLLLIIAFLGAYMERMILPALIRISETKAQEAVAEAVDYVRSREMAETIAYDNVVYINADTQGRVMSVHVDYAKLNDISIEISSRIQHRLDLLKTQRVSVPLGMLMGNAMFSASGPQVSIGIFPAGKVQTEIKSMFSEAGINQTRHTITLEIKAIMEIVTPLTEESTEIKTSIPITETIIVGSIPDRYSEYINNQGDVF